MKHYRLLTQKGYPSLKKGEIYPENHKVEFKKTCYPYDYYSSIPLKKIIEEAKGGDWVEVNNSIVMMERELKDSLNGAKMLEEQEKQNVLDKCKLIYPVGTKFIDVYNDEVETVASNDFNYDEDGDIQVSVESGMYAFVCAKNEWAEIVEKPINKSSIRELLEKMDKSKHFSGKGFYIENHASGAGCIKECEGLTFLRWASVEEMNQILTKAERDIENHHKPAKEWQL